MKELIKYFPRQVSFPQRVTCDTEDEFYKFMDKLNGIKRKLYYSLYNCNNEGKFNNAMIDKIAFDLDSEMSFDNVKKLNKYCVEKNLKHIMIFSTGGFWFYIFTKNYQSINNKKDALGNAQRHIANECGLSIGDEKVADIDHHIISDIARVGRMPNTYDIPRQMYCIPIYESDLRKGMEDLKKEAKKQRFHFEYYGEGLLDMKQFDYANEKIRVDIPDGDYDYEKSEDSALKTLYPCVMEWLTITEKATWKARWYATLWFRDMGYPRSFVEKLMKK